MEEKDYYDTIEMPTEGIYKEKGSKFLSYAYPVKDISDIEENLSILKSIHPKSRHICYAYRMGISGEDYRINDDGEPSGTAGRPIMREIKSKELSGILVAVVRYFGGTKLGASGLINAYKTATQDALDQATIKRIYETQAIQLYYPIEKMGQMYQLLKNLDINSIDSHFGDKPYLGFELRKSMVRNLSKQILADYHGYKAEELPDDFTSPDITIVIT